MTREDVKVALELLEENLTFDELSPDGKKWIDMHETLFTACELIKAWDKVKADITSMDRMAHGQTKRIISDIKAIINKRLREVEE